MFFPTDLLTLTFNISVGLLAVCQFFNKQILYCICNSFHMFRIEHYAITRVNARRQLVPDSYTKCSVTYSCCCWSRYVQMTKSVVIQKLFSKWNVAESTGTVFLSLLELQRKNNLDRRSSVLNESNLLEHWRLFYFHTAPTSISEYNIKRKVISKIVTLTLKDLLNIMLQTQIHRTHHLTIDCKQWTLFCHWGVCFLCKQIVLRFLYKIINTNKNGQRSNDVIAIKH